MAGAYITIALVTLLALPGNAFALEQRLIAADGAGNDILGRAVALDGDTAVVGASRDDSGTGAVYVFTRVGNLWIQTAKLTASDGAAGDQLGTSVAIDGDTIVAGAPVDNASQGSAYTFTRTGAAARTESAKLTSATSSTDALLGGSVAIAGDTIVAGAPEDDVGPDNGQGSVHTFARTGLPARTETARLTASDGAAGDELGYSVAIDGDTIVAGARNDNVANTDEGSVYTFASAGDPARTQTAKLTAADNTGFAYDALGSSVAIDGDTIVAGAREDDLGGGSNQGSVLTFARTGAAARSQTARLYASDGVSSDHLGYSVAIDGDAIIAGAPKDISLPGRGAVYSFTREGATPRTETARVTGATTAGGDMFGLSVAIDGDTILAGAPLEKIGDNTRQGSASVFFAGVPEVPDTPSVGQPLTSADTTAPSLTRARLSRRRFRVGRRGTMISFRLSEAARVAVRIERKLRRGRPRRRYRRAGTFTRRSRAGTNRIRFTGRIGRRKLKPGSYRLTLTPTDAAGNRGKPRRLTFRVSR